MIKGMGGVEMRRKPDPSDSLGLLPPPNSVWQSIHSLNQKIKNIEDKLDELSRRIETLEREVKSLYIWSC